MASKTIIAHNAQSSQPTWVYKYSVQYYYYYVNAGKLIPFDL